MQQSIFQKAILGLAMSAGFAVTAPHARAADSRGALTGAWVSSGAIRQNPDCTGAAGAVLLGMDTYLDGGTMFHTDNIPPAGNGADIPGSFPAQSPGHGIWAKISGREFTSTFVLFTFDAGTAKVPGGSPSQGAKWFGSNVMTRTITLSDDKQSYTAITVIKQFDANRNLISTGCITEVAHHLQ